VVSVFLGEDFCTISSTKDYELNNVLFELNLDKVMVMFESYDVPKVIQRIIFLYKLYQSFYDYFLQNVDLQCNFVLFSI
jgi:hypothetical protein